MATFWIYNPNEIINVRRIKDIFPASQQTYTENMNSISRSVILFGLLGAAITGRVTFLISGLACLLLIILMYKNNPSFSHSPSDGFTNAGVENLASKVDFGPSNDSNSPKLPTKPVSLTPDNLPDLLDANFETGTSNNPFSNVLLTDITDKPERLSAPPAFNHVVGEQINDNMRKNVREQHDDIPNADDQMFGGVFSGNQFKIFNRTFYSTPSTRVTNDQGAFAKFLYGDMPSGKEQTPEGSIIREERAQRHILR